MSKRGKDLKPRKTPCNKKPAVERFENLTIPEPNSGCHIFTGSWNRDGYGYFKETPYKKVGAHRFAWLAAGNSIPEGHDVAHRCHVRCCVNPDHLTTATRRDNVLMSHAQGRSRWQKGGN